MINRIKFALILVISFALMLVNSYLFYLGIFLAILFIGIELYNLFKIKFLAFIPLLIYIIFLSRFALFGVESKFIVYLFLIFAIIAIFYRQSKIILFSLANLFILTQAIMAESLYFDYFKIFVLIIVASILADIGGYLVGSKIGKHKLAATISPNKTIEGFVGGYIFALLFLILSNMLVTEINWILIILLPIISQIGDLVFSYIKRLNHLKDYSNLLAKHGGMMDRYDSISFCMMLTYIVYYLI